MIDDMNSDQAYLCTVYPDEIMHYNIDCICMFDINSIQLDSFIMGTNENSKNIHVSHDVSPEERENLREEKREKKRKKKKKEKENEGSICLKTCKGQKIIQHFIPIGSKKLP